MSGTTDDLAAERFARWWKDTGERELRQVLYWRWDPLGVSDYFPSTADEYDGYAPGAVALLRLGVDEDVLKQHLEFLEREQMALPPRGPERCAATAQLLRSWFADSVDTWARDGSS